MGIEECVGGGARPPPSEEEEAAGPLAGTPRRGMGRLRSRLGDGSSVGRRRGEEMEEEEEDAMAGWGMPLGRGFLGTGGGGIIAEGGASRLSCCGLVERALILGGVGNLDGGRVSRPLEGDGVGVDTLGTTKLGAGSGLVGSDGSGRIRLGTLSAVAVAVALGVVCSCSASCSSMSAGSSSVTSAGGVGGTPLVCWSSCSIVFLGPVTGGLVGGGPIWRCCWRKVAKNRGSHCGGRKQSSTTEATMRERPMTPMATSGFLRMPKILYPESSVGGLFLFFICPSFSSSFFSLSRKAGREAGWEMMKEDYQIQPMQRCKGEPHYEIKTRRYTAGIMGRFQGRHMVMFVFVPCRRARRDGVAGSARVPTEARYLGTQYGGELVGQLVVT